MLNKTITVSYPRAFIILFSLFKDLWLEALHRAEHGANFFILKVLLSDTD